MTKLLRLCAAAALACAAAFAPVVPASAEYGNVVFSKTLIGTVDAAAFKTGDRLLAQAQTPPAVTPPAVQTVTVPPSPNPTTVLVPTPAAPSGGVIDIGAAFGWLGPYVNTVVGAVLSALVGWILVIAKSKLNISIDDSMRSALETWLKNQASSLVAAGVVKVEGLKISVPNAYVAAAANTAGTLIPDALAHFGLSPDVLAAKIVNAIPQVPTVAAVAAAQATPAAANAH